ncbi:MAG TPA: hypothetical protein VGI10_20000 [Polyangiaceae bacterium]|jgi:hypothetical protein
MNTRTLVGVICWTCTAVTACSARYQQPSPVDLSSGPVAEGDFPASFASAYCQNIAGCCASQGFAVDGAACSAALISTVNALLQPNESDSQIIYDPDAAGHCIDAYRAALTTCTDPKLLAATSEACAAILQGTLQGSCMRDRECYRPPGNDVQCSPNEVTLAPDCTYVTSFTAIRAKLSETCSYTCAGSILNPTCYGGGVPGQPAGTCWLEDGVGCGLSGRCESTLQSGQDCSVGWCAAGSHCENSTCVANSDADLCAVSSDCSTMSYCAPASAAGFTGGCFPRKPDGATCTASDECAGGQCTQAECRRWTLADANACSGAIQLGW